MKKILFILLNIIFFYANAQTLYRVKAVATDNQSKATVKILHIEKKHLAGFEAILKVRDEISQRLLENAYYTSNFDSLRLDTTNSHCVLYYTVGKQYKWLKLGIGNCNEAALSKSGHNINRYNNRVFSAPQIKSLFEGIISFYENHGYPFAEIGLDSVRLDSGNISAVLDVTKNRMYKIDSIIVKGTAKIAPAYLYNYLSVKPDDIYDEAIIKKIGNRINELPFLQQKKSYKVVFTKKTAKLYLYLAKKKADKINGIIGFLPDNTTGKIRFTGQAELSLQNAFGRGEKFEFNWQNLQKQTQNLTVNVNYPFIFNLPFGVAYSLNLYKKDSSYLQVKNNIGLSYLFKGDQYIKFFVNTQNSSLLNAKIYENSTVLPDFADTKNTQYGIQFYSERFNYKYNPTKGFAIDVSFAAGERTIQKNPILDAELYDSLQLKSLQYEVKNDAQYYVRISPRNAIKIADKTGLLYTNGILFDNELFKIGGLQTIRGFDDESILANLYTIQTVEYHFLLEQNSYLYLFFDYGYYTNFSKNSHYSDYPYSFGPGISFQTGAGIFSINYALGSQKGNPILLKNGKVHFGFVNYF